MALGGPNADTKDRGGSGCPQPSALRGRGLRRDKPPQLSRMLLPREKRVADDHTHEHHPERSRWEGAVGRGARRSTRPTLGVKFIERLLLALGFVSAGSLRRGEEGRGEGVPPKKAMAGAPKARPQSHLLCVVRFRSLRAAQLYLCCGGLRWSGPAQQRRALRCGDRDVDVCSPHEASAKRPGHHRTPGKDLRSW